MQCNSPSTIFTRPPRYRRRSGAILVWCALLLPVLIAMVAVVIDGGLIAASYRERQNAADAAALAAAMDLMIGRSGAQAIATAHTFVTDPDHGNLPDATVTVNIPAVGSPYAGLPNYVEVIVTTSVATHFAYVFGIEPNRNVTARAIAGFEPIAVDEGVIALSPTAKPGLWVDGNGTIRVEGRIVVNSTAAPAAKAGKGLIYGEDIEVAGSVDNPDNFRNVNPSDPSSPLQENTGLLSPDPFGYLPTPMVGNGVDGTNRGSVSVSNGQTVTLLPGVYQDLQVTGGTVTFEPGIYVIQGGSLTLTGGNVTGNGVMFYVTGKDYNPTTGAPDASDPADPSGSSPPPNPGPNFGQVTINADMHFTPIDSTNPTYASKYPTPEISVFDGILFYQRRLDSAPVRIEGDSESGDLQGTIYAKWAPFDIAGQGTYDAQFAVGSIKVTGKGVVTVNYTGENLGKAPHVVLVE